MIDRVFQKFTTNSKQTIKNAFDLALSFGHKIVTPCHILYSLSQQNGSIGQEILNKTKFNSLELKEILNKKFTPGAKITQINFSLNSKKLLEKAVLLAGVNRHRYIGTEHLLAAIIENNDSDLDNFLSKNDIKINEIIRQTDIALNSAGKLSEMIDFLSQPQPENKDNNLSAETKTIGQSPAILDLFAIDLTDSETQKKIDPVIGRENEIERLMQILSRRHKNNPMLLGEPGVGKTAIIEGLAKKITQNQVPEFLTGKKIYALDLSSVVAGTSFRGEFENRFKQIITEVQKNPDIILFIDEIHNIINAGSSTGSMDAANILKPALARGEIRCIGATTLQDYKKQIENDPALQRRFQPIIVNQPTVPETIEILQGLKRNYETFHQVRIADNAILAAVELSNRYITDRFLPDKAIDLIDEAAAATKIKTSNDKQFLKINRLENQLQKIIEKKSEKIKNEEFNSALGYKKQEDKIIKLLGQTKKNRLAEKLKKTAEITETDITKIIAKSTGIPVNDLLKSEKNRLLKLEKSLGEKIIGQAEALKIVSESIRRAKTGITNANRPTGSFIFLGPSGVGKTELAKVIAEKVFGSPENLIRIDMSEFSESFNASKLIGAPAGYVGYKEGAKLTDQVKTKPYSVVLFDEIEKAHPQIFNLFLQILEDGQLTDSSGKIVNFKNTIIIMTSNIGSENFNRQAALGFDAKTNQEKQGAEKLFSQTKDQILKQLKSKFLPEFLSRIDKTIIFNPLELSAIIKITKLQLDELKTRLEKQGLKIKFDQKLPRFIAKTGYSAQTGARGIRKTIQETIEGPLAKNILARTTNKKTMTIRIKNDKITL